MISPERLEALQKEWVRLLERFGVSPAAAYPPFDELVAAYSSPERHYHNLEHLGEMFRVVGRLAGHAEDLPAIQLAVWFHDAVYDPRANENEARSAELAARMLAPLAVPNDTVEKVQRLVRSTAHLAPEDSVPDSDTAVLLDADLAILGASEERYRRYAAHIRSEYAFVRDADYRTGRSALLRRFLARPRIYITRPMFEEGEARARANLANELRELDGA
jgi:predicted metal-dependent HD superfamily phosphohydrolase